MHQRLCSAIYVSFANIFSTQKEELQNWGFLLFLGEVLSVLVIFNIAHVIKFSLLVTDSSVDLQPFKITFHLSNSENLDFELPSKIMYTKWNNITGDQKV